jgi:hypothetical protein
MFEGDEFSAASDYPYWWSWYSWPYWWSYFNSTSSIMWKMKIEPEQQIELNYDWHYFWR